MLMLALTIVALAFLLAGLWITGEIVCAALGWEWPEEK